MHRGRKPRDAKATARHRTGRFSLVAPTGTFAGQFLLVDMCEKCIEIDKRIERFKRIVNRFTDQQMVQGLTHTIAQLEAEKAALHPDRK